MRQAIACLVLGIFLVPCASGQASVNSTAFHWLAPPKDAALLARINGAFSDLLKPDDPEKVKPYEPMVHKSIATVGVFRSAALVLMLQCDTIDCSDGKYFQPFNMDLSSGKITELDAGFYDWKFKQLAQFETTVTPDIVFGYYSCWDCEADYELGSIRYDASGNQWKIRWWGDKTPGMYVGGDTTVGVEEGDYDSDCLYRIMDFEGVDHDQVIAQCVFIRTDSKKIFDRWTAIFEIKAEQPSMTEIKDPHVRAKISAKICAIHKDPILCPAPAVTPVPAR
jgi:hypothetical protein